MAENELASRAQLTSRYGQTNGFEKSLAET